MENRVLPLSLREGRLDCEGFKSVERISNQLLGFQVEEEDVRRTKEEEMRESREWLQIWVRMKRVLVCYPKVDGRQDLRIWVGSLLVVVYTTTECQPST